ncbi:MAG: rhodanese-like domain-containing protein [Acidobacteriota bacterium]|nr:rhodanese-like domain-containing protein [Acidobacteriota bacterium]
MGARELKQRIDAGDAPVLIDVRSPEEWEICHLDPARLIPLGELPSRMHELDSSDEIVFLCKSGQRSAHAAGLVQRAGFGKVLNLRGGLLAWGREVDPDLPIY